jgi:hypothetical protein
LVLDFAVETLAEAWVDVLVEVFFAAFFVAAVFFSFFGVVGMFSL